LPAAALADLAAALRPRDRRLDRLSRNLWWATASAGLVTGLAGMAASQEIELRTTRARDMMFAHGLGNLGLVLAAAGVAAWRTRNRANLTSAMSGLLAAGAAGYTAYLGGELVYTHGAGVTALGGAAAEAPALFSGEGVARLGRDAGRGLAWLVGRAFRALTGQERVERSALGPIAEAGTGGEAPAMH
jgi:uncharacterized membrane protein